jgi:hypothetical protein
MNQRHFTRLNIFPLFVGAAGLLALMAGCPPVAPECASDADCDDALFCNGVESCDGGICISSGDSCSANQTCDEENDVCIAPPCTGNGDCDDGDVCTDDTCDGVTGECVFTNNTAACDDEDNCTENDACADDVCAGIPIDCAEGETCVNGICVQPCVASAGCDNGLFCNGVETCDEGACTPGAAPCGDDGAFCNGAESCNEDTDQCEHSGDPCAPSGLACDEDADECTLSPSTLFFDDFEEGIGSWFADNGVWEVGVPTSGPNSAHSPENVAATVLAGDYPDGTSSRLVSPSIQLPEIEALEEVHLRFWHWFSFSGGYWGDFGVVQIREQTAPGQWGTWTSLNTFDGFSGVYTNALVDLSGYAGKKVQVGFFLSQGSYAAAAGWYIDDVTIDVF